MLNTAAYASNNGEEKANNGNEASTNNTSSEKEPDKELIVTSPNEEVTVPSDGGIFLGQKPDSTNLNSVSKFNFIFYFIYKLKYDEDPNSAGHLNYEF